jgi:VRR-NUC domain
MGMRALEAPEALEQAALFQWAAVASIHHPELALLHAIPNGGHRHKATARALKSQGVKAGVPDLCLPCARGGYHGLYIELKRRKGGTLSLDQRWWCSVLAEQGYHVAVCRGWESARQELLRYLDH